MLFCAHRISQAAPPQPTPSALPTLATPVPVARNQIVNQSLHAIRDPVRPGPCVFHRGANRLQPASKSRASSLYALVVGGHGKVQDSDAAVEPVSVAAVFLLKICREG